MCGTDPCLTFFVRAVHHRHCAHWRIKRGVGGIGTSAHGKSHPHPKGREGREIGTSKSRKNSDRHMHCTLAQTDPQAPQWGGRLRDAKHTAPQRRTACAPRVPRRRKNGAAFVCHSQACCRCLVWHIQLRTGLPAQQAPTRQMCWLAPFTARARQLLRFVASTLAPACRWQGSCLTSTGYPC